MNAKQNKIESESGQTLLVSVLIMAVLMGFMAMAVDVGLLFEDRRHLQNSADAMALAGVQELPMNPLAAEQQAENWAANNGIAAGQIATIDVRSTYVPNDTLYVEIDEDFGWIFARVLGMDSDSVSADAAAVVGTLTSGEGHAMPWALLYGDSDCLDADGNAKLNETCSVKVGAQGGIGGWRGALDFDGNGGGASEYESNIIDGTTDTVYCIDGTYAPEPPQCEASVVDALDGNKVGPTGSGIDERLTGNAKCDANGNGEDDFDEVFLLTGGTPPYTVACPDSPWLIMIPIVSPNQVPVQTVTIKGWALGYLDTYSCASVSAAPTNAMAVLGVSRAPAAPAEDDNPKGCKHKKSVTERSEEPTAFVQAFDPGTAFMPVAGGPASPPRCHTGTPHGQQTCPTPTPTPAPTPTPSPVPTPSPSPTPAPTPTPTSPPTSTPGPTPTPGPTSSPTPSPTPGTGSCNGNGHWEVQIEIVDASYSAAKGFLTGFDPAVGITVRRLIE